ncbi:cytochrome c biogenesis CcdA family protein [soil metagenome]
MVEVEEDTGLKAGAQARMTPSGSTIEVSSSIWKAAGGAFAITVVAMMAVIVAISIAGAVFDDTEVSSKVLSLAIPAFAAGVFSVLSPCSLPIVLGYFSVAFREERERIGRVTVAFLAGVGTTMTVLGASFTALGSLAIDYQEDLARVGGVLVIGFGVMSFFGKGFSGFSMSRRAGFGPGATFLYGLVFALGWTTCVGPILGSILTLLLAEGSSSGGVLSLAAGGSLSLIYVLGLGAPIFLLVLALRGGGSHRDVASRLRGRGFDVSVFGRTLQLHTISILSGVLLIGLGILLFTGEMTRISQELAGSRLAQFSVKIEGWLPGT